MDLRIFFVWEDIFAAILWGIWSRKVFQWTSKYPAVKLYRPYTSLAWKKVIFAAILWYSRCVTSNCREWRQVPAGFGMMTPSKDFCWILTNLSVRPFLSSSPAMSRGRFNRLVNRGWKSTTYIQAPTWGWPLTRCRTAAAGPMLIADCGSFFFFSVLVYYARVIKLMLHITFLWGVTGGSVGEVTAGVVVRLQYMRLT